MTLAKRVIPVLLQRGNTLVKGKNFDSWRSVGHARQAVKIHEAREVDELVFLDIATEGRGPDFKHIESLTRDCYMPLTIGGGVRNIDDVKGLMDAGADKVSICTRAMGGLIVAAAQHFGSQAIVASIDVKDDMCWAKCGQESLGLNPVEMAELVQSDGAGEILLTSIEREGTLKGYDEALIKEVSEAVDIPVIANGGCGTYWDMLYAVRAGASAVASGAMFQFSDATPKLAAEFLERHDIEVRT